MDMKYIMDDVTPIIFCPTMNHDNMARRLFGRMEYIKGRVTSAGFLAFRVGEDGNVCVHAYGKSESLGIESQPERDSRIITRALNAS
jgi:hypothetical protein